MEKINALNFAKDQKILESEKNALCTISNDPFIDGTRVLIYSFLKNNPWFRGDIIVITCPEVINLSSQNRYLLKKISNKVIFHEVKYSEYFKVYSRFTKLFSNTPRARFLPSFFTYEAFELAKKYERLLYLDSDMLIRSDLSDVFMINSRVPVVTPDAGEFSLSKNFINFNGGFLYLTSNIDQELKNKLLDFSVTSNDHGLAEQSIMNSFFKGNVLSLDSRYNCLKRCFPDPRFNDFNQEIKIIHYVGAKPWHLQKKGREAEYSRIENLWYEVFNQLK